MISLITDSASQIPPALAARLGVIVVPVTVTIDGRDHLEGVELSADGFYDLLARSDALPVLATSQPSASAFVAAFEQQIAIGATSLLAVLVGSLYSGAVNSAEVAARDVRRRHPAIVVDVVDSGSASFGIACAVWAAADAIDRGDGLDGARQAAIDRAAVTGSVFMIDGTELARRSGRFDAVDLGTGLPVLASGPDGLTVLGEVRTIHEGVELMVDELLHRAPRIVAAVGRASTATDPITDELIRRLRAAPAVAEIVEYRVGASIATHTGPNTVGGFAFPA